MCERYENRNLSTTGQLRTSHIHRFTQFGFLLNLNSIWSLGNLTGWAGRLRDWMDNRDPATLGIIKETAVTDPPSIQQSLEIVASQSLNRTAIRSLCSQPLQKSSQPTNQPARKWVCACNEIQIQFLYQPDLRRVVRSRRVN